MSQLQLIPFLARLAAEAGQMTGVAGVLLLELHNPVEVAECIASLDVIWRGNFVFGVGLGYREVEFDAFKVPKGQRVRRFEQGLEIVKRLWTEDKVTAETDVCTLVERDPDVPARAAPTSADLDRRQRRRGRPPRGAPGRRLVREPARHHGHQHAPDGDLSRGAGPRGKAAAARAARDQRDLLRAGSAGRPWRRPGHTWPASTRRTRPGARTR